MRNHFYATLKLVLLAFYHKINLTGFIPGLRDCRASNRQNKTVKFANLRD